MVLMQSKWFLMTFGYPRTVSSCYSTTGIPASTGVGIRDWQYRGISPNGRDRSVPYRMR